MKGAKTMLSNEAPIGLDNQPELASEQQVTCQSDVEAVSAGKAMRAGADNVLEAAMEYAGRGWSIVPTTFDGGKKPCRVSLARYQRKPPSKATLRRWFRDGEHLALAVVLGEVSGHLGCRDFDKESAYTDWAEEFPDLATTLPTVRTGRGYHVYFTAKIPKVQHYTDGELRGEKCLCCLPPSRHPAGQGYDWTVALPDGKPPAIDPAKSG